MKSITVFHVDDDQDELDFFNQIITDLGHRCKSFTSGNELLQCIDAGGAPDMIFVDIYMPKITGLEVASLLRDFSSMAETPIVAVTGSATEFVSNALIESGVNYILEKSPHYDYFKGILYDVIREQLGDRLSA